jgi:hypothetical protein
MPTTLPRTTQHHAPAARPASRTARGRARLPHRAQRDAPPSGLAGPRGKPTARSTCHASRRGAIRYASTYSLYLRVAPQGSSRATSRAAHLGDVAVRPEEGDEAVQVGEQVGGLVG